MNSWCLKKLLNDESLVFERFDFTKKTWFIIDFAKNEQKSWKLTVCIMATNSLANSVISLLKLILEHCGTLCRVNYRACAKSARRTDHEGVISFLQYRFLSCSPNPTTNFETINPIFYEFRDQLDFFVLHVYFILVFFGKNSLISLFFL